MKFFQKSLVFCLFICVIPVQSESQTQVPYNLSLAQAIEIAQNNNPAIHSVRNDENIADWAVKSAYGSLIPNATTSGGANWQGSGEQQFGSLTAGQLGFANQPSYLFSSYSVGLNYNISGAALMAPGQANISFERDIKTARAVAAEQQRHEKAWEEEHKASTKAIHKSTRDKMLTNFRAREGVYQNNWHMRDTWPKLM